MVRLWVMSLFLLSVGGCASSMQREVRELTDEGVRLHRQGRYKEARETFEAALARRPGDPNLLYNLARSYERGGQPVRAEKIYHECLFRSPDHPECRHALAGLLVGQNRMPEAERMVEDWLVHSPNCAAAHAEHGWLLRQQGDLPRAHSRFQQALTMDRFDRRALVEFGQLFEVQQQPEKALVLYERADQAHPNHPDIQPRLQALKTAGVTRPRPE